MLLIRVRAGEACQHDPWRDTLSNRAYGILAGVIGSALGAWWYSRYRTRTSAMSAPNRGTVIFDNTPTASDTAVF